MDGRGRVLCTNCGYLGWSTRIVPGSNVLGIFLLFFFILPGLIYAVWQQINSGQGCPVCKHTDLIIPVDSPRAKQMIASGFAALPPTTDLPGSQTSRPQPSSAPGSVSPSPSAARQTPGEAASHNSWLVLATVGFFAFGIIAVTFYSKSTPVGTPPVANSSAVKPAPAAQSASTPETTVTITTAQDIIERAPESEQQQSSTVSETVTLRGTTKDASFSTVPRESSTAPEHAEFARPETAAKTSTSWNDVMAASNFYDASNVIKSHCMSEWPNNPSMFDHCTKRQQEAVRVLDAGRPFGADRAKWSAARVSCASEWPTDYVMRLYCEQKGAR